MTKLSIPHDALVFVGDGQKALSLRNSGDEKFPNLVTERVFSEQDLPTREQGTDRPGRGFASAHTTRRAGFEETDWHELEKVRFADHVASALEQQVRGKKTAAVIVVAPRARLRS